MYSLATEVHVQFVYSFNTRLYCFNKLHHYNAMFTSYGNLLLLGISVHGTALGIVGMGTIGAEYDVPNDS